MRFLTFALEAQLHREVYSALLNGLLQRSGSKRELAQRAGITSVYLSYILKLDRDPYRDSITRTPSPKAARQIAQSIDAPAEVRESLLAHMTLASEKRLRADDAACVEILERPLAEVVDEIQQVRLQAIYAATAQSANQYYRLAVDAACAMLQRARPESGPLDYVDLCAVVNDCQCVLNRADDALWHAKIGCAILDSLDPAHYHHERERFDYSAVNMVRMQGVAYHNLGHCREALNFYRQAEAMEAVRQNDGLWERIILRDKIKALSGLPRFSITEVENLADRLRAILEKRADSDAALDLFLLSEALADAYLLHQNYKDAGRVLTAENNHLNQVPHIGPLHRVLFLRTFAKYCRLTRNLDGWTQYIGEAYRLAVEAGLAHQRVAIEAELRRAGSEYPVPGRLSAG
ncbi:MAG: hypothetical protein M1546_23795 [Chloroflexi bacterium]|nr:hypothetical protein [Chloroflexota bacterium]